MSILLENILDGDKLTRRLLSEFANCVVDLRLNWTSQGRLRR